MDQTTIITAIRRIVRSINLESKRLENNHGISLPQLLTLRFLQANQNQGASQKAIKDYLSLNASTVTGIITRLEKKGLIVKSPPANDRRLRLLQLSPQGENLLENLPVSLLDALNRRLSQLDPAEFVHLQASLHWLAELFDPKLPSSPQE